MHEQNNIAQCDEKKIRVRAEKTKVIHLSSLDLEKKLLIIQTLQK